MGLSSLSAFIKIRLNSKQIASFYAIKKLAIKSAKVQLNKPLSRFVF